jgi:hypothetical protein
VTLHQFPAALSGLEASVQTGHQLLAHVVGSIAYATTLRVAILSKCLHSNVVERVCFRNSTPWLSARILWPQRYVPVLSPVHVDVVADLRRLNVGVPRSNFGPAGHADKPLQFCKIRVSLRRR